MLTLIISVRRYILTPTAHCGHFEHNIQTAASSSRTCNSTSPEHSKVETSCANASWHFIKIYSLYWNALKKGWAHTLVSSPSQIVFDLTSLFHLIFMSAGVCKHERKALGRSEDFFSSLSTCLWVTRNLLEQPRDFHSVSNLHNHPWLLDIPKSSTHSGRIWRIIPVLSTLGRAISWL